ncbi:MAG: DUF460 domain-containing protein [Candidatus Parvarchaeota archaeon]|nr:DUF460 domain-containing protein [Candidatus Jingweiarchaeum tengchongense]MCW1297862.1 DUF460 domain-containing protein [Candidatus Jingweiarchaeum tengchongense]MCW1299873.1 DUF460 domain-containing protein [Candidatus Jingweiarchaeum tengchongense]MCW1304157.1 DUF460 domain-containing protein [Candidatus Jingweiarchaeum tengchongense]MCW1305185.1 DUF460 domain-containing protein [Candidatus Jingweiarchaeum tengchongense]
MNRYLIVGIDPGTTTAFCALDLNGNLIAMESSKKFNEERLLKRLFEIGKPIILSCDVNPCPSFIEHIASKIRTKIIIPEENLRIFQKHEIVNESKINEFKNMHERDALASAFFAFKYYMPLFKKIDELMKGEDIEKIEEVKRIMIFGEAKSIKHAIELGKKEEKKEIGVVERIVQVRTPKYVDLLGKLKQDNENLKKLVEKLRNENILLKREISIEKMKYKFSDEELMSNIRNKEKTINILSKELEEAKKRIDELEFILDKIKRKNKFKREGKMVLLEIECLNDQTLNEIKDELDQDTIISAKFVGQLSNESIKIIPNRCIICANPYKNDKLTIINTNEIKIMEQNGVKFVEKDEIMEKTINEIISSYKEERKAK